MKQEGRLYGGLVAAMAGGFVAMALALNVLTVSSVIGPFHFFARGEEHQSRKIGLWIPASAPTAQRETALRAWQAAIVHERDALVTDSLRDLRDRDLDVLAVVDGQRLTDEEAGHLLGFVRAGGGVLLTGLVGVRGADDRWRGDAVMRRLLRVDGVDLGEPQPSGHLRPLRRGPLVAGLEPGRRIAARAETGMPSVPDAESELAWEHEGGLRAASRRLTIGAGRIVWLAASPRDAIAEHSRELLSGGALTRVVESSLAWLAREPRHEMMAWPNRATMAALRPENSAIDPVAAETPLSPGTRRAILDRVSQTLDTASVLHLSDLVEAFPDDTPDAVFAYAGDVLRGRAAWLTTPATSRAGVATDASSTCR